MREKIYMTGFAWQYGRQIELIKLNLIRDA